VYNFVTCNLPSTAGQWDDGAGQWRTCAVAMVSFRGSPPLAAAQKSDTSLARLHNYAVPPEPAVNVRSDNYRDTTIMPLADCCCCCCCCYCCSSCCCHCRPNRHLFVVCRHRRLLTLATPGTTFLPMNYIHVFRSRFFRLLMSWRRFRVCPRKSLLACFLLLKRWIKMYTKKCKSQNN